MRGERKYRHTKGHVFPQKQTGKVAKLMGMSDEGVRLYEKHGLVYPEKAGESGYRAFDIMDITMLLYGRVYRESGFSIKEAGRLANACEMPEVAAAYRAKAAELRSELELQARKVERVEEIAREIELLPAQLGRWELASRPGLYRLEFFARGDVVPDQQRQAVMGEWMRYVPFTMLSTRYFQEKLRIPLEKNDQSSSVSGLGVDRKYASLFSIQESSIVRYHPPVRAAHAILHANNAQLPPDFSSLFPFLEQRGLQLCGDILSLGVVNLHFGGEFDRYFHIWAPVEPDRSHRESPGL